MSSLCEANLHGLGLGPGRNPCMLQDDDVHTASYLQEVCVPEPHTGDHRPHL